jgi:hypothetical protein
MSVSVASIDARSTRSRGDRLHLVAQIACLLVIAGTFAVAAQRGFGASLPIGIAGLAIGAGLIVALFRGSERQWLLTLFLVAFAVRVVAALVTHPLMVTVSRDKQGNQTGVWVGFLFEDDRAYHKVSWALSRVWHGTLAGVARSDEYLLKNYSFAVGGLYYLMTPFLPTGLSGDKLSAVMIMAPKMMNLAIGSFIPVVGYVLGREMGGRAAGVLMALALAFWPSLLLWSVLNLKDTMVVLLIAVIMLATIKFARRPSLAWAGVLLASFTAIEGLRLYVFYAFGWLVPIAFFLINRAPWRRRLAIGVGLWVAVVLIMLAMNEGNQWLGFRYLTDKRQEALYSSREFGADTAESGIDLDAKINRAEGGWSVQLRNMPIVLPYVLWAPFPWQAVKLNQKAIAPEVVAWYGVQALCVLALVVFARDRWRELMLPVVFIGGLVFIFALIEGNVGTIFRHRSMLFPPAFLLAALGLTWLWQQMTARRAVVAAAPSPA